MGVGESTEPASEPEVGAFEPAFVDQSARVSPFVNFPCQCGRSLRAKVEQAGTEIRCWDCQRMVVVPTRRRNLPVLPTLVDAFITTFQSENANRLVMVALALTAALAVPYVGVGVVAVGFILAGSLYGEVIRVSSRDGIETEETLPELRQILVPSSVLRCLVIGLAAVGTAVPLWLLNSGVKQSPHLDRLGVAILTLVWVTFPVLMFGLYAEDALKPRPVGIVGGFKILARHPVLALLTLAIVPLALVALEAGLATAIYISGNLPFYALDYMPIPGTATIYDGIPHYRLIDYRRFDQSFFIRGYFRGLRSGYSLVTAIPASLSLPTRARLNSEVLGLYQEVYTALRMALTLVILTSLAAASTIQARWLGAIALIDRGRAPLS
jgi:hypothetical protein